VAAARGDGQKGCGRQGQREKHREAQAVYISKEMRRLAGRELQKKKKEKKKKKKRAIRGQGMKKSISP